MSLASQITSVLFRSSELICAAVVVGILGDYLNHTSLAHVGTSNDIVYTVVIGGLSLFFALLMIFPWKYQFYAFILDFLMFIMWMVSFGLLRNLTGGSACTSSWYWQNWGWYYGGYAYLPYSTTYTQSTVGLAGCNKMQAVLAFDFIGGWFWLLSSGLGLYVSIHARGQTEKLARIESGEIQETKNSAMTAERDTGDHFVGGVNVNVLGPR